MLSPFCNLLSATCQLHLTTFLIFQPSALSTFSSFKLLHAFPFSWKCPALFSPNLATTGCLHLLICIVIIFHCSTLTLHTLFLQLPYLAIFCSLYLLPASFCSLCLLSSSFCPSISTSCSLYTLPCNLLLSLSPSFLLLPLATARSTSYLATTCSLYVYTYLAIFCSLHLLTLLLFILSISLPCYLRLSPPSYYATFWSLYLLTLLSSALSSF